MIRIAFACAVLTGCAPTLMNANEAGGIAGANFNMSQGAAIKAAEAHCRKYGKIAHVEGRDELRNDVRFSCVKSG